MSRSKNNSTCRRDALKGCINIIVLIVVVFIGTGIPISHQHLIWQGTELENDYCLSDYPIQDGATLKLVLNMRGGPINTRRSKFLVYERFLCWPLQQNGIHIIAARLSSLCPQNISGSDHKLGSSLIIHS